MKKMMNEVLLTFSLLAGALFSCEAQPAFAQDQARYGVETRQIQGQGNTAYFPAPVDYEAWWKEMEDCAGAKADISTWAFVAVNADAFVMAEDSTKSLVVGAVLLAKRRIYLVLPNIKTKFRVQHEMLHAILHDAGLPWAHKSSADLTFDKCSYR